MKKIIITMMVLLALTTSVFAGTISIEDPSFEDGSGDYTGDADIDADTLNGHTYRNIRNKINKGDDKLQDQINDGVSMDNARDGVLRTHDADINDNTNMNNAQNKVLRTHDADINDNTNMNNAQNKVLRVHDADINDNTNMNNAQNKVLRVHDADINDNTNMNNAQNKVLRANDADINDNTNMNNAQNKVLRANDADIKTFQSREARYLKDRVGGGISRTTVWNMLTGQKSLYDNYEYIVEFLDTIFVSHAEMAEMELKVSALEDAIVNKEAYRTSMAKALGSYDGLICYGDVNFCYEVN